MNIITVYSITGVIGAAVITFVFLGNGSFNRILINEDAAKQTIPGATSTTYTHTATAITFKPIDIKIKSVAPFKASNNKSAATLQVAFDVHNPNTNTMILDGIHYNLYVKNVHITSGDIGTEAPEDIIRSQNGFPIIANSTVTLKNTQAINNVNAITWENIAEGKANYIINGTYSYRQTAGLQASGGANQFSLAFPK
jgi:LEA14-like dessication related protein